MRILTAIISLFLTSTTWAAEPAVAAPAAANCVFSYKPDSVKVFWTGYKFTEKKGAKGEFKGLKITSAPNAKSADELIKSTAIDIDALNFDTGDAGRDSNLRDFFFKKIKGPHIMGTVTDYKSGILKVKTQMNGVSKVLAFLVSNTGNKYTAATDFDMIDTFKMKKPHESISQKCVEQHRGADHKSKTWTQVSLALEGEIVNSCDAAAPAGATGGH